MLEIKRGLKYRVSITSHISSWIYICRLYGNVYVCLDIEKPFVNLEDGNP